MHIIQYLFLATFKLKQAGTYLKIFVWYEFDKSYTGPFWTLGHPSDQCALADTYDTPSYYNTLSPQTHLEATLQDSKDSHNNGANSEPG